ncbi:MAG: DUF4397 domain-containing protein [Candidatus Eiseniibacteriota bacterium]|jgi:hypothetical protein
MTARDRFHRAVAIASIVLATGVATASAQTADVQVIHNSPDPAAAVVDIYLDMGPTPAIDDFGFREATPVLSLPAGVPLQIGVAPGNSSGPGDIIASFPVTLTSGSSYVVMACGVVGMGLPMNPEGVSTDFTLAVFEGLRTAGTGGQVDLLAFHGAPDAPTVNVVAQGVGTLFPDLTFKQFATDYLSVPPANYLLDVEASSNPGTPVATFQAPLAGLGGGAAVVFASGWLTPGVGASFGLFAALPTGDVLELTPAATPVESTTWGSVKRLYQD